MKILTLNEYLRAKFGAKVYKLSMSAGCTCPNRDGTVSTGGCAFCSEGGSGDFATDFEPVSEQIKKARNLVDQKFSRKKDYQNRKYIAYFQSFTNTYGDQKRLMEIFREAASYEEICAVSIGTRPDCLTDEMLDFLWDLNKKKEVWIELGLQTVHEETGEKMNRGWRLPVFEDAYKRIKERNLTVVLHVILGLPGETEEDMLETVKYCASLVPRLDGIKLQMLHVLKGTALGREYESKPFRTFEMEEYCNLVVKALKCLPEGTVIHRMTGDGPKRLLLAPLWSGDKKRVMNLLNRKILEA